MQDTILFATTIRENITFGRPDATEAEIVKGPHAMPRHTISSQQCRTAMICMRRRARHHAFRRTEAAAGDCPRLDHRSTHTHPRRCHRQCRYQHGTAHSAGIGSLDGRAHDICDCAPAQHGAARRSNPAAGKRAYRRRGTHDHCCKVPRCIVACMNCKFSRIREVFV